MLLEIIKQSPLLVTAIIGLLGVFAYILASQTDKHDDGEDRSVKTREISRKEVAKHSSLDDLWIVIDNEVFDFTSFVGMHPGGDKIGRNAGGDASFGFYGVHHPERAFASVRDYLIGYVPEDEKMKEYTVEEVKQNEKWVICNQRVFDLSNYEKENSKEDYEELLKSIKGKEGNVENDLELSIRKKLNPYFKGYIKGVLVMDFNREKYSPLSTKHFTAEEVAKHNKPDDAWIIINKKVYDITKFVKEHPGGDKILVKVGGDSTKEFLEVGHPNSVNDLVRTFFIGYLKDEPKKELKKFTKEEVAKHNKREDAWIIINNKVYDVTNYIDQHPGGHTILENVGHDSTQLFIDFEHPDYVEEIMESLLIGYV